MGAKPFIFPCMGSHGAATAEGQRKVLETYGITEEATGVPIRASMDTVITGTLDDGTPVHMDRHAAEADGIVVINRIKPHTGFRGPTESGLTKMLSIGIGKIVGAATYHRHGMDRFPELLPKIRDVHLAHRNVLFGVGIVENAYDETARIELVSSEQLATREPVLQDMAKELMPRLFFDEIDVLIIEEMGKNISGAGFDPNITGRNRRNVQWSTKPMVKKIVVLGLTRVSHGNATGIGGADVITMRLVPRPRRVVHLRQRDHRRQSRRCGDPDRHEQRPRCHRPGSEDRRAREAGGLPRRAHPQHAASVRDRGVGTDARRGSCAAGAVRTGGRCPRLEFRCAGESWPVDGAYRGGGMSHLARGSLQRGGGAPSQDGDPTAEAIIGAAIPLRRNAGRIPTVGAPAPPRSPPRPRAGIDSKAIGAGRRHEMDVFARMFDEAAA